LLTLCVAVRLVYSRSGYGSSDLIETPREVDFMHREALEVLPKILDEFDVRDAALIGHSDGASIAIIFAGSETHARARIHALVLEAPHVYVEDLTISSIGVAVKNYNEGELKKRLEKYHEDVEETFRGWCQIWLHPEFRRWNIEQFIPSIRVPILVIQGKDDRFGMLDQVRRIQDKCLGSIQTKILPDCRHRPHREYPEETLESTVDFLRRYGPYG
jgi:pimeloyl-ACP methyl ester carboxylesterase